MEDGVEIERVETGERRVLFCSRCGAPPLEPVGEGEPQGAPRVCASCGLGVYLTRPGTRGRDLGRSFLVVSDDMTVTSVSSSAEGLVGPSKSVVGAQLGAVLASPHDARLRRAVRRAAHGFPESVSLPVTAKGRHRRRLGPLTARVLPCGSPRAALVVLEPRLR